MYFLWWLLTLIAGVLLIALVVGQKSASRRGWLRITLAVIAAFLPAACVAACAAVLQIKAKRFAILDDYYRAALWLAIGYVIAAIVLLWRGLRTSPADPQYAAAAHWPMKRLSWTLVLVLVLHVLTFYWIDRQVTQQLASLD